TATEDLLRPFRRGLWIDIFPLDGSFKSKRLRYIQSMLSNFLKRGIFVNGKAVAKHGVEKNESWATKPIEACWKLVPVSILHGALNKLIRLKMFDQSTHAGNLLGRYGGN